jgi:hypothetical protein
MGTDKDYEVHSGNFLSAFNHAFRCAGITGFYNRIEILKTSLVLLPAK